jgi:hypothetical protein
MLAAQTPSKHTKITARFGSTGSSHGIPPNLGGHHDTKRRNKKWDLWAKVDNAAIFLE